MKFNVVIILIQAVVCHEVGLGTVQCGSISYHYPLVGVVSCHG